MRKFYLLEIIIIITAAIIQISLLAIIYPLNQIKLVLVGTLLGVLLNRGRVLTWIFIGGIVLDIFSVLPFFSLTFSLLFATGVVILLFRNVFTSGSLYTAITLGVIEIIAYNLALVLILYFLYLLKITDIRLGLNYLYHKDMFWQIVLNVLIMVTIFSVNKSRHLFVPRYLNRG